MGVIAATRKPETGMAISLNAAAPRTRRSRTSPTITAAPTAIPVNHMPWEQAQSQETGMSHHRGRRSRAVRSQALVTINSRMNDTS